MGRKMLIWWFLSGGCQFGAMALLLDSPRWSTICFFTSLVFASFGILHVLLLFDDKFREEGEER